MIAYPKIIPPPRYRLYLVTAVPGQAAIGSLFTLVHLIHHDRLPIRQVDIHPAPDPHGNQAIHPACEQETAYSPEPHRDAETRRYEENGEQDEESGAEPEKAEEQRRD